MRVAAGSKGVIVRVFRARVALAGGSDFIEFSFRCAYPVAIEARHRHRPNIRQWKRFCL